MLSNLNLSTSVNGLSDQRSRHAIEDVGEKHVSLDYYLVLQPIKVYDIECICRKQREFFVELKSELLRMYRKIRRH